MAISKTLFASFLISLLILHLMESDATIISTKVECDSPINPPAPGKIDCGSACKRRCALSSRQHLCKRACGTCCKRCNCVPSGTIGHYEECLCYASLTTHGGRRKCP